MKWFLSIPALISCQLIGQTAEARYWADHWADVYSVPRELVYAVIEVESGWNPMAVSRAGAVGLTMRALAAAEAMPLHHTGEALTFGRANDVHGLTNAENTNVNGVTHRW